MQGRLVRIPAGEFVMGSRRFSPEETPVHLARVAAFRLEEHTVTNAQFEWFVTSTGYVPVAERALAAAEYPRLSPGERVAGGLVFQEADGPVDLRNWRAWWSWAPGAGWSHPTGPGSDIRGRGDHPIVQVC